jgi:hypothetical protein
MLSSLWSKFLEEYEKYPDKIESEYVSAEKQVKWCLAELENLNHVDSTLAISQDSVKFTFLLEEHFVFITKPFNMPQIGFDGVLFTLFTKKPREIILANDMDLPTLINGLNEFQTKKGA